MNQRPSQLTRFRVMAAMALAVLAIYLVVLFNTQVVHHEEYLAKSIQTITRMENVEASRGIITDRSGRTLVTNQSTYSLTFDASLLKPGENQNDAILRLVTLCRDQGVAWEDNLPLSLDGAAHFTVDTLTDTQKSRFFSYLRDLKPTRELLAAYVRQHPELLKPPKEGETALDPATAKDTELLKQTNSAALTNSLLLNAGVTPAKLFDWMREDMKLSDNYSDSDARLILGVRYELKLRKLGANNNAYVLAQNVDVAFCSLISDGQFQGAKIIRSSARQYATTYAAHILGTVGGISDYTDDLKERGYRMDDTIGLSGAEAAFEDYLRGADGKRMISVNSDGKITGEYYSVEPRSGYTVELTVDLKLQQAVEDTLAAQGSPVKPERPSGQPGCRRRCGQGRHRGDSGAGLLSLPMTSPPGGQDFRGAVGTIPPSPLPNRATSSPIRPRLHLKARHRRGGTGIRCHHHHRDHF